MAIPVVLVASPHMLRIRITGEGGEGRDQLGLPQAELVALCAAGPLKELFTSPLTEPRPGPGVSAWANLHEDARLSVTLTDFNGSTTNSSYLFDLSGEDPELRVDCNAVGQSILELRFNHTLNR